MPTGGLALALQEADPAYAVPPHTDAHVAPIYHLDGRPGTYTQLRQVDVLFGVFQRGATVMRTSYAEFKDLAIRRADVREAITIFRRARLRFPPPVRKATQSQRTR